MSVSNGIYRIAQLVRGTSRVLGRRYYLLIRLTLPNTKMNNRLKIGLTLCLVTFISACGSGGGSTSNPIVFSGTAAVGAALGAASILIYDSTGALVGSGTADATGQYAITLSSVGKAPYVLKLVKDEKDDAYKSVGQYKINKIKSIEKRVIELYV